MNLPVHVTNGDGELVDLEVAANWFSYLETFFRVCLMKLHFMSLTEMVSSLIWRSQRMTSGCRKNI